jgi:hypothetical protein
MTETHKLTCYKCQKEFDWNGCPSNCVPIAKPNLSTDITWPAFCTECRTVNLVWLRCQGKPKQEGSIEIGWSKPQLVQTDIYIPIGVLKDRGRAEPGWVEPPTSPPPTRPS